MSVYIPLCIYYISIQYILQPFSGFFVQNSHSERPPFSIHQTHTPAPTAITHMIPTKISIAIRFSPIVRPNLLFEYNSKMAKMELRCFIRYLLTNPNLLDKI